MSFTQIPWENRVFRIDRECYLLFLGIDELDIKPFVRIGNSSWLNEQVLEVISHTVITESFTGNPFGEVGLTHKYRGRYLGEPKIVEVIKSFFDRFHVADPDVISYREQEEREGKDHVYFYNTGNIVVTFGEQRLFDLYAREKSDRHYNYYCSEILTIFRKNPLRWEGGSIREKGLFRVGDDLYFFDGSKLLGLKWDKNYFKKLARAGWNPDRLEGILVDLKPDEMEGDKSAGVMNFIKRGIAAKNPMTFFSRDKSFSGKIEPLFEYVQSRDVPIRFKDISAKGKFEWNGTAGEWEGDSFVFHLDDKITAKINEKGGVFLNFDGVEQDCLLPDGVPVRIYSDSPDREKLKEFYIDRTSRTLLRSEMKADDILFVKETASAVAGLFDGLRENRNQLSPPQEKSFSEMKRLLRNSGKGGDERVGIFACNCVVFLSLLSREDGPLAKKAEEAAGLLGKTFPPPRQQADDFLFSANCYGDGCFYLPYKLDISAGDRKKAADMHEALLQCDKKEVDFFFSERKRLEAILNALNEGTLWEDMKKYEESLAEDKSAAKKTASSSSSSSSDSASMAKPASSFTQTGTASFSGPSTARPGAASSKGKKWPLIGLLLLLLALLGLLGYDYFGRGDKSFVRRNFLSRDNEPVSESGTQSQGHSVQNQKGDPSDSGTPAGSQAAERADGGVDGEDAAPGNGDSAVNGNNQNSAGASSGDRADSGSSGERVLTGREDVPDSSPLSGGDAEIIPSENGTDSPEVKFIDTEDTIVTKPFVMDNDFLDDFTVGGIRITMADIHLKANAISVMNGYRDLGFHVVDGADPTIIEPGLILKIPGDLVYKVKPDDNIWYIAARLLESELAEHTNIFEKLKNEYSNSYEKGLDVSPYIKEMNELIETSNCENFRKEVQSWLDRH